MPFSTAGRYFNRVYYIKKIKFISSFCSEIVTLQVRIPKNTQRPSFSRGYGKRVFLSVSGSLTLEASLVLSLLIFASVILMLPMKILNTERRIQASLEAVGEDFSKYAYLKKEMDEGFVLSESDSNEFAAAFCRKLFSGIAEGYAEASVIGGTDTNMVEQVTMKRSEILEDGEWIDLILDYEIRLPFPVLGISVVSRTARCRRRAWIGKEGNTEEGAGEGKEMEEMVYLGKQSTRYHRSRSCHYLSNRLTAVSVNETESLRNNSGGRYYPCAVCCSGAPDGTIVYLLPEGNRYHCSKICRAITAYVRMVPLSEVSHLGACSYCGEG